MGEIVAGEIVPVGGYELVAVGLECQCRDLIGHFVEFDAVAHVDEGEKAVLALELQLLKVETVGLLHHGQIEVLI